MARGADTITPSTATAWLGAPPTTQDGFAFANGDFYAEVSGQQRHRRATVGELKEHFFSGNDTDHPAHWFEAQLIHYGLKPSKSKSVARMRLFDAVNAGNLTVPGYLASLESKLRKEWAKNDKNARRGLKSDTRAIGRAAAETQGATGGKRKAKDGANATSGGSPPIPCSTKKVKIAPSPDKPLTAPAGHNASTHPATRSVPEALKSSGGGNV